MTDTFERYFDVIVNPDPTKGAFLNKINFNADFQRWVIKFAVYTNEYIPRGRRKGRFFRVFRSPQSPPVS